MRTAIPLALFAILPVLAGAQQKPTAPQLLAGEQGAAERSPLRLAKADVHVVITAGIAETTLTLTFGNDTPRLLEGELVFPLPENAAISGFGLDVNGVIVDGVPVERDKARVTYETETRKRVDPGLVEHTVGNNFRTRVYPIPPKGSRTIKLQYVSDLVESAGSASFRLPLNWDQTVDEATIRVNVVHADVAPPTIQCVPGQLAFDRVDGGFVAEHSYKDMKMTGDLTVAFQTPKEVKPTAIVDRRLHAATMEQLLNGEGQRVARNEHYFVLHDAPPALLERSLTDAPNRIGILWDASLSRLETDKKRELALLRQVIASMDPKGTVDLVVFRNEPDAPVSFPVTDGGSALIAHLEKITYDGGTNLSLLPVVKNYMLLAGAAGGAKPADYSYWLLFSDGIADLGPDAPAKLDARLYAISNDAKSNHTLLRRLATQTGGAYLNLQRVADADVIAALTQQPYTLLGIDVDRPGAIDELYPRNGVQPVPADGGRVTVTGRLLAPEVTLTLKYGRGGVVMNKTTLTLKQADATQTGLIARFWAQQKAADLSADVEANGETLATLGKEFNLVTPNTSLLVLENVDQYLQHKIVPPRTATKLYEEFMTRIEQQKVQVGQTKEQRVQHVLAMWKERVTWWEAEHKVPPNFTYKAPAAGPVQVYAGTAVAGGGDHPTSSPGRPAAAAPATPAPAPVVHSPAANSRIRDEAGKALEESDAAPRAAAEPGAAPDGVTSLASAAASSGRLRGVTREMQAVRQKREGDSDDVRKLDAAAAGNVLAESTLSIAVKHWDPNVPYLKAMREAGDDGAAGYAVYLKQRPAYLASPAFYLDCAEYLFKHGQKALATRVLTNVAELKLDNAQLLRIVAHKLNQTGDRELAINLFERILKQRPEEPQSYRDLALAIADRADASAGSGGDTGGATLRDYERALDLLNHVVMTQWDRFDGIEVTALMEANRILDALGRQRVAGQLRNPLDPRLVKNLDCDVRIVLTWDADLTDVDLWVTEPSGEKCDYSHNRTAIGGLLSRDFTQGYGPEEYCLRHTMPGQYKIQANYYGSSQTSLVGPCTVQATVITNFGRPTEKRQTLTLRLETQKDVVEIGSVTLK